LRIAAAVFGGLLLLFLAIPSGAVPSNHGTVKIQNTEDLGQQSNDPKPGCPFYVEGFGMNAASGTLVIDQQAPTGTANVVSTTWTANDVSLDGFPDHHFLNGPFNLPEGHYKLYVSDTPHDKMKVFKVECAPPCTSDCEPCTTDCTTTTGTTSTSETSTTDTSTSETSTTDTSTSETSTTQVPVFPTGTAAVLGTVGALGGSLLMLRRKL